MSKKKTPLEKVVDATVRAVLKGGNDKDIINQLCCMQEHINRENYSREEIEEVFPMYLDFSVQEMKKIRREVWERLKGCLYNPENTYQQTFRMILVASVLEIPDVPAKHNNKVKFCKNYWRMCCGEGKNLPIYLKEIQLLDKQ